MVRGRCIATARCGDWASVGCAAVRRVTCGVWRRLGAAGAADVWPQWFLDQPQLLRQLQARFTYTALRHIALASPGNVERFRGHLLLDVPHYAGDVAALHDELIRPSGKHGQCTPPCVACAAAAARAHILSSPLTAMYTSGAGRRGCT